MVELDLRRMIDRAPGAGSMPADVGRAGVGAVEVWVPRDADVRFTGESA
jgi:hypothetical protein